MFLSTILCFSTELLQVWTPTSTSVRTRTRKPNVQRPLPPHYEKARLLAAVKPIYAERMEKAQPWLQPRPNVQNKEVPEIVDTYERLLAERIRARFLDAALVLIFHENSTNADQQRAIQEMLHGHHMKTVHGSKKLVSRALVGTPCEPILRLHVETTCYLCCQNFEVKKALKFVKKMPTLILLGGFAEGRLLTRNDLQWCSQLPDMDTLRAETCRILSSASVDLSTNLSRHQQSLLQLLETHAKGVEPA